MNTTQVIQRIKSNLIYLAAAFCLMVVVPIVMIYAAVEFLQSAIDTLDQVQRERAQTTQAMMIEYIEVIGIRSEALSEYLKTSVHSSSELVTARIVIAENDQLISVAASDRMYLDRPEQDRELFLTASTRLDQSQFTPFARGSERYWRVVRATETTGGQLYYLVTDVALSQVDQRLSADAQRGYALLLVVVGFLWLVGAWLIYAPFRKDVRLSRRDHAS